MPAYPVKFFHHTMEGAPQLTDAYGSLVGVLDACLVNGFNLKNVTSITNNGAGVAELTIATGHGFIKEQIILIAGADQAEYNGEKRVTGVSPTTLTFDCAIGVPTATGVVTVKTPPLGFAMPFSVTRAGGVGETRVYQSTNVNSNKFFLRVDDSRAAPYTTTYAKKAKVTMLKDCPAIDGLNGDQRFYGPQAPYDSNYPTWNHVPVGSGSTIIDGRFKWYYARKVPYSEVDANGFTAGTRAWTIVGDDRGFYLCNTEEPNGAPNIVWDNRAVYSFTDIESFMPGDQWNTVLTACESHPSYGAANNNTFYTLEASNYVSNWGSGRGTGYTEGLSVGKALMKSYTGVGSWAYFSFAAVVPQAAGRTYGSNPFKSGYDTSNGYPIGPGYGIFITPVFIREYSTGFMRGIMPGKYWVLNNVQESTVMLNGEILENLSGYSGKKFLCVKNSAGMIGEITADRSGRILFDIYGPWH